jgi:hypothetical protein
MAQHEAETSGYLADVGQRRGARRWMRQPPEQRRADIALAQRLAQEGGTLFEVAERYLPSRIADAVTHASQAGRAGVVLIDFVQHSEAGS